LYLPRIAAALQCPDLDPLLVIAIVMTMAGLAFKVAAAPFHLWAPDAYEGAPVPAAAFIASGSKVAGFFVLAKVALIGFKGAGGSAGVGAFIPGWVPLLAALAVLSMLLGNLAALAQKSVRRLLAYSAVAHAGYMLLAVLSGQSSGFVSLVYYVVTYGLTTLGAFHRGWHRQGPSGRGSPLRLRRPGEAFAFVGILYACISPFTRGHSSVGRFLWKFYVFSAVLRVGSGDLSLWWLVAMALAMSAVSLYYYLQVLKQVYVVQPEPGFSGLQFGIAEKLLTTMLAAAVVVLGCFPELVLSSLNAAVQAAGL
jgi:NADH-quinone oxidoreductase subunit N